MNGKPDETLPVRTRCFHAEKRGFTKTEMSRIAAF